MTTSLQISLAEYDWLIKRGFFERPRLRDRRIELIRGKLHQMSPPGPSHEEAIDKLTRWSVENTAAQVARVRIQNSIGLPELESAPQPDLAWVREQSYRKGRPTSDDVFLVIEVSDSSLNYDRTTKAKLYADAGIADYWVVNLRENCIEVFREPKDGEFQSHEVFERGHVVRPLRFPKVKLKVSDLFDWYAV